MKKINYLFAVICLFISSYSFSQNGKINGVITYFFNKYQGDKPDIGSEVFILDTEKVKDIDFSVIDSFYMSNVYRKMVLNYKSVNMEPPTDVSKKANDYKSLDETYFNSLDERTYKNFLNIKFNKETIKTVVDGAGNFSVDVKPGNYYVIIKSHNRNGRSISESDGQLFNKTIKVKQGETINVSRNFKI